MDLHYIDGSPFARIARILVREHDLEVSELEIRDFPPPKEFLTLNPMGQVPVLVDGDSAYFPTRIVIDVLLSRVASDSRRPDPPERRLHRQIKIRIDPRLTLAMRPVQRSRNCAGRPASASPNCTVGSEGIAAGQ